MTRRLRRPVLVAGTTVAALGLGLTPGPDAAAPAEATSATAGTVTGTVVVRVADHPPAAGRPGRSEVRTSLRTPDGDEVAVPAGLARGLAPGRTVTATLAVTPASGRPVVTALRPVVTGPRAALRAATRAAAVTSTAHTLTVLPVYWSSKDAETTTSLAKVAAATAAYWKKQSGGRVVLTSTVRGWKKITNPSSCNTDTLMKRALAAHGLKASTTTTKHVLVYFPERSDCGGWAGLAGVDSWDIFVNGANDNSVVAHEFGHNLGLGHANTYTCTRWSRQAALTTGAAGCANEEYADYSDVMGVTASISKSPLSAAFADQLGWAAKKTANASPAPGSKATYTLTSGVGAALRAVRVVTTDGDVVYLEYRPSSTLESYVSGFAGVQARWLRFSYGAPDTELLDLKPQRAGTFASPAMTLGVPWPIPGTSLSALVTAKTATTATLVVAPSTNERTAPAVAEPDVTADPDTGRTTVTWPAASDGGTGVASYTVLSGTTVVGRVPWSTRTFTADTTELTDPVRVEATDWAGNTGSSAPVTSATGTTWDGFVPATPTVTAPAGTVAAGNVTVTWTTTDATADLAGWRVLVSGVELVQFRGLLPASARSVTLKLSAGTRTVKVVPVSTDGVSGAPGSDTVTTA